MSGVQRSGAEGLDVAGVCRVASELAVQVVVSYSPVGLPIPHVWPLSRMSGDALVSSTAVAAGCSDAAVFDAVSRCEVRGAALLAPGRDALAHMVVCPQPDQWWRSVLVERVVAGEVFPEQLGQLLALNEALSPGEVSALFELPGDVTRVSCAAVNPMLPDELFVSAVSHPEFSVRSAVALCARVSVEDLAVLATDEVSLVWCAVATNARTPEPVLDVLSRAPSERVGCLVARHVNTAAATLRFLVDHGAGAAAGYARQELAAREE